MNPEDELADLVREWKEIDLQTLELAIDTGRKRSQAQGSVWLMIVLDVFLVGITLTCAFTAIRNPEPLAVACAAFLFALSAYFVPFTLRQFRRLRTVDLLLHGPPTEVVRARRELLLTELYAWQGREARFAERVLGPVSLVFLAWQSWRGEVPVLGVVAVAIVMSLFAAYGRWVEVPALNRQVADLDALLSELEDPS